MATIVKSQLLVTEVWGDPLVEFQTAINALAANGTFNNVTANFDARQFYLRGEGPYSVSTNILPPSTVSGNYVVTNPSGTYKQVFPSWDSPAMPNGWLGLKAPVTAIGMLINEDEHWLVLPANGGFVALSRVSPA